MPTNPSVPTNDKSTTATIPATPATGAIPGGGDHDRVVMASRKADGTPDQTPDFEYIGDKETAVSAAKTQLGQQAASAVDVAEATTLSTAANVAAAEASEPDADIAKLKAKQEAAIAKAEKAAEAEVNARYAEPKGEKATATPRGERA